MSDILKFIESYKREEIAAAKAKHPQSALKEAAFSADPVRPFAKMINARLKKRRPALIAEIKKASPSRGLIRADFDPAGQAQAYADGGACCLSVLTDSPSFQGSAEDLRAARAACALPVLRKDFIFDPYQIYQSRLMGADCILIIMAALDIDCARECENVAHALSMDAILEVHNGAELDRALALSSPLIGINNRDLRSFETRLETCEALAPRVPPDRTVIAESGLHTAEDVSRMNAVGVQCFLVGESLMRAGGNLHQTMRPFVLGGGEDRHGVNGG